MTLKKVVLWVSTYDQKVTSSNPIPNIVLISFFSSEAQLLLGAVQMVDSVPGPHLSPVYVYVSHTTATCNIERQKFHCTCFLYYGSENILF